MPTSPDSYAALYLREVGEIAATVDPAAVDELANALADVRRAHGRLFVLGVGGGAAHASHAVNDFRKLCDLEAYAPTDNVAEITARTNDEGWETTFEAWLRTSRISSKDAILVFSVGGGSREHNVSVNLVRAIELAREVGARVYGVVGRADGVTAREADACIVVETPPERRTPHVEEFQAIVWHLLVSHPALATTRGKWESVEVLGRRVSSSAVFLDRDGVIVELVWDAVDESFEGPNTKEDVRLAPGAAEAIGRIRSLDYRTVVVSNQPGAAKGKASRDDLLDAHAQVVRLLAGQGVEIDDYRYCFHHPDAVVPALMGDCDCRKPKPGMLLDAAAALDLDLSRSWMIGDSDTDVEAARAAGCRTVLVENPRSTHRRASAGRPDYRAKDVADAVEIVAGETR